MVVHHHTHLRPLTASAGGTPRLKAAGDAIIVEMEMTAMTSTMSADDRARFLQALKENAEFRDEVRRQLLSDELLELPDKFAQFAEYVNEFMVRTEKFMAATTEFIARTEQFMAATTEFIARTEKFMAATTEFIARTEQFMDRTENRMNRMEDNIGILKGNATRRLLRDHFELVLELTGTDFVRILSKNDLIHLVRNSGQANEIPYGERRSFYAADLVIEAVDPQDNTCYVTAEASYTADNRDTGRAIRNAEFLTRFTGHPAQPVVASIRNDREVQDLVNKGTVQWLRLDEQELEAD